MITFIKNYSIENIKNKLILLYILNVTDIIFTLLLLSTGYYIEANLFMVKTVQSLITSFILKVILPATLLLYLYMRIQKATNLQLKKVNFAVNILTVFYVLINTSHLIGIIFLGIFIYIY